MLLGSRIEYRMVRHAMFIHDTLPSPPSCLLHCVHMYVRVCVRMCVLCMCSPCKGSQCSSSAETLMHGVPLLRPKTCTHALVCRGRLCACASPSLVVSDNQIPGNIVLPCGATVKGASCSSASRRGGGGTRVRTYSVLQTEPSK